VYASCALPGFFPPGRVGERTCIDGGVVDNLPVSVASQFADLVIAVDVGSSDQSRRDAESSGFAGIYMRAATMMMHALQQFPLEHWHGPPMVLIRPRVDDAAWLSFTDTAANIAEGYRSATRALERIDSVLGSPELRLSAPARADRREPGAVHRLRHLRLALARRDGDGQARARRSRARTSSTGRPPKADSCTNVRRQRSRGEHRSALDECGRAHAARPDPERRRRRVAGGKRRRGELGS
jgi:predicted acylesterase/phospholipase RssA